MKVRFNRAKLLEAFQIAAPIAPVRSPKPILRNVKLDVGDDGAVISATDLEMGIRCTVSDVEVQASGSALLPVDRFGGILRESQDEFLEIEADPQGAVIRGERSEFKLPGENPEEFPDVATFSDEKYYEVPARFLKELIRRTVYATDTESSRYALGGVLFEFGEDKLTAVGTDGRRLAKMEGPVMSVGGVSAGDQTTIVPTRSLQLIERALSDSDAEINIAAHGNDILVQSPRMTVFSRLVEGRFPKWRDVFPQLDDGARIELPVGAFHSTVRQAAVVTSEESRGIEFTFGNGNVVLAAEAAEAGQSHIELPISYDGDPITIMLDPKYFGDFLKVIDSASNFTLAVRDDRSAAVCSTDDGYGYVIMPMARDR